MSLKGGKHGKKAVVCLFNSSGFPSTDSGQSHRVHPVHEAEKPHSSTRHRRPEEAERSVGAAGWVEQRMVPKIHIYSFCNCAPVWVLSQSVHSRRPRGTARQTTLLTAAFTQTAKAARCRPSTGAPTPAQNRSRMSLLAGRNCAGTPARCIQALVLQTDSLFFFCPLASCLHSDLRLGQGISWRLCVNPFKLLYFLQASFMSVLLWSPPPQREFLEGLYAFEMSW